MPDLVIKDCTFTKFAYGIYTAYNGQKSITVDNCTFTELSSWSVSAQPKFGSTGDVTIKNSDFIRCNKGLAKVTAITAGHTLTISGNTFTDCQKTDVVLNQALQDAITISIDDENSYTNSPSIKSSIKYERA